LTIKPDQNLEWKDNSSLETNLDLTVEISSEDDRD